MGSHDPARLAYWQQRKDELTGTNAEAQTKLNKRRPFYKMADRLLNQSAPDDTEVRQDVIGYIDDWFEANPSKMMEPDVLQDFVGILAPVISAGVDAGDGSQQADASSVDDVLAKLSDETEVSGLFADGILAGGQDDDFLDESEDTDIPDDRLNDLETITRKVTEPDSTDNESGDTKADDIIAGLSKETLEEASEFVLSMLPGTGNVLSARDAVTALIAAKEAAQKGDYGDAALEGVFVALGIGGAVPGAGVVFRAARKLAKGLMIGRRRAENVKKLVDIGLGALSNSGATLGTFSTDSTKLLKNLFNRMPESITKALNKGHLKGGHINHAKHKTVHIYFKGGMDAANKKFDQLWKELGIDPGEVEPLGEGKVGRKFNVDNNTRVNVRITSSKKIPTVEIYVETPISRLKLRFNADGENG